MWGTVALIDMSTQIYRRSTDLQLHINTDMYEYDCIEDLGGGAAKKYNPNGKLWVWKYRYFIVFCYNGIRYKFKYLFRPLPKNVKGGPKLNLKTELNWAMWPDLMRPITCIFEKQYNNLFKTYFCAFTTFHMLVKADCKMYIEISHSNDKEISNYSNSSIYAILMFRML